MNNIEKVNEFLDKAGVFTFITIDNGQPKGRPFGFHLLDGDKLYFGCGTFKNVFKQILVNPNVEILAVCGNDFLRYDGKVKIVKDEALLEKVRLAMPQIMALYDKNGWEMGLFYLEEGHVEIRDLFTQKESFDI